jgi:GWxTD domain-containing protein
MLECRLAAEIRELPFGGEHFEAWGGVELGLAFNLLHEGLHAPSRKDTVQAALKYIATSEQLEDLQSSSDDDLDTWLNRFWRQRNVTGSARDEVRAEYERRIRRANEQYGTESHMGVATDMGRVLLLYGEPDRIENGFSTDNPDQNYQTGSPDRKYQAYSPDRKYQLWVLEGRVKGYQTAIFLFVTLGSDRYSAYYTGRGGYREVYSNVRGEYSDGIPGDLPPAMLNFVQSTR